MEKDLFWLVKKLRRLLCQLKAYIVMSYVSLQRLKFEIIHLKGFVSWNAMKIKW